MITENNSIIYKKCFKFSLEIIDIYRILVYQKKEFIMSKQLLRSGTSIGANLSESFNAQSNKDYVSKLYISLKEASEAHYWLKLLIYSNYIEQEVGNSLIKDISEIIRILSTIIKNNKRNHQ
ncbi:hypothetical protein CLTEP_12620 [Clostridium tepidiprofundi DSM 19306]|uniref:Four helix bundle protein n=1 Tax=Clostridium tepidiprofundi DSM 19306 TaxID=1121338 RepID=A0A151B565_9CLOT|nr:four helix bundle protein [Clostridium tepidiprofundi]KYH34797.1 hypothetical protein CLTEP_12620 [Clostridium tepidiprofundi DSM 19306]